MKAYRTDGLKDVTVDFGADSRPRLILEFKDGEAFFPEARLAQVEAFAKTQKWLSLEAPAGSLAGVGDDDAPQYFLEPEPEPDPEPYTDMTVAGLKAVLRDRGLPVSGTKAELIARLME